MRTLSLVALAALVTIGAAKVAEAADYYNQTVTTPADGGFAVSTELGEGVQYALQPTADVHYKPCERDTRSPDGNYFFPDAGPVPGSCRASTNDMRVQAEKILDVPLPNGSKYMGFMPADGGASVQIRIYRVNPRTLPQ